MFHRANQNIVSFVRNEAPNENQLAVPLSQLIASKQFIPVWVSDNDRRNGQVIGHWLADSDIDGKPCQKMLDAVLHSDRRVNSGNPGMMGDHPGATYEEQRPPSPQADIVMEN